jgi:hypothetical protein
MAMAALSPNSVMASPVQVNPQISRTELQNSAPQVAQEAQKVVKTAQTDTVTISAQALKMADGNDTETGAVSNKAEERKAGDAQEDARRNALKAYAAVSAAQ